VTAAVARPAPPPAPRERPIIFTGAMVRALRAGTKTQTRRLMKPQPTTERIDRSEWSCGPYRNPCPPNMFPFRRPSEEHSNYAYACPYGRLGDRLWVREGYHNDAPSLAEARAQHEDAMSPSPILYRADLANKNAGCRWRPAIFLPRWASRFLLEITEVRTQRLDELTREDAIAEGCPRTAGYDAPGGPEKWFRAGWDLMHADEAPAASNPWVWAITFDVVEGLADV
jgi:hypothetical protein